MDWHPLIERIPADMTGLRDDLTQAFGVVDRFGDKAKAINSDATLSETGRRQRLQEEASKGAREHLAQLKQRNAAGLASIAARRKNLEPVIKDRSDVIGELRRIETRRILKDATPAERSRLLFSGDREIIEAVIDARPEASGLIGDEMMTLKAQAVERYLEKTHGPALRQIDADEAALKNAGAALQVASQVLERLAKGERQAA